MSAATISRGRLAISAPIESPVPALESFADRQLRLSQVHRDDETSIQEPVYPLTGRLGGEQTSALGDAELHSDVDFMVVTQDEVSAVQESQL